MEILPVAKDTQLSFLRDIGLMRMAIHGDSAPFDDLESIWSNRTPPSVNRTFKAHLKDFFAGKDMSAGSYSAQFSNFAASNDAILDKDGNFYREKRIDLLRFAKEKIYLSDDEKESARLEVQSFDNSGPAGGRSFKGQVPGNRD